MISIRLLSIFALIFLAVNSSIIHFKEEEEDMVLLESESETVSESETMSMLESMSELESFSPFETYSEVETETLSESLSDSESASETASRTAAMTISPTTTPLAEGGTELAGDIGISLDKTPEQLTNADKNAIGAALTDAFGFPTKFVNARLATKKANSLIITYIIQLPANQDVQAALAAVQATPVETLTASFTAELAKVGVTVSGVTAPTVQVVPSQSNTQTPSATQTPTTTETQTPTASVGSGPSPSETPTGTPTGTQTPTQTSTGTRTPTQTKTPTKTISISPSFSPTAPVDSPTSGSFGVAPIFTVLSMLIISFLLH